MANKLKLLDLFSGIGGFSLGLERTGGFETVAFCEYDEKAQLVLKKHWPDVPIFKDVRDMNYEGSIDVISGGYPCQPFSVAGKRKGKEDDRHLWPPMFDLVKKHRPTWVIGENVAGHINMGLDSVLADLESENYSCQSFIIPACGVNAPHRRDRVWIVAYSDSQGQSDGSVDELRDNVENSRHGSRGDSKSGKPRRNGEGKLQKTIGSAKTTKASGPSATRGSLAHPKSERTGKRRDSNQEEGAASSKDAQFDSGSSNVSDTKCRLGETQRKKPLLGKQNKKRSATGSSDGYLQGNTFWAVEPSVGRVAHGVPRRMDRLKQLGNAVVPQIPEIIGNAILAVMKKNEESLNG